MSYYQVFQAFIDAFFPVGTLSAGARAVFTAILAVVPIFLIIGAFTRIFGGSKSFVTFLLCLVCIILAAEYLVPLIPVPVFTPVQ